MSNCPSCGRTRGAHRQEEYCAECLAEGCTSCMPLGYCEACTALNAAALQAMKMAASSMQLRQLERVARKAGTP